MTPLRLLLAKLRALACRGRDAAVVAEELAAHFDLLVEDLVRDGVPLREARRQARLRLGGTTQVAEAVRDQRGLPWLDTLARNLRLAVQSLRRNRLFAVTATLSLAVGVAANTMGFGFLYGYLIRPLPFADGSRLVSVLASAPSRGQDRWGVTLEELRAVQGRTRSFDAVAAASVATVDLTGAGEPRRLQAGVVSTHLFEMLGIRPIAGRLFTSDDERGATGPVCTSRRGPLAFRVRWRPGRGRTDRHAGSEGVHRRRRAAGFAGLEFRGAAEPADWAGPAGPAQRPPLPVLRTPRARDHYQSGQP